MVKCFHFVFEMIKKPKNANLKFKSVALGQTYFAVQTRKTELTEEEYSKLVRNNYK